MIVQLDRENCIGCSACATICSEFWFMDEDGKSRLKGATEVKGMSGWFGLNVKGKKEEECNKKAADLCPVKVIHVQ
jgi:ferredoxin